MPKNVDLTLGKLESLLHMADLIRGVDSRMELQTIAVLLYVARRTYGNEFGSTGITMEEIANALGIAQSSCSRNVSKLSDKILNPPREILERAAKKRRPPTRAELKPKFGLGLLSTEDDPIERRRKVVFLTPMGHRFVNKLMDYAIAAQPSEMATRKARLDNSADAKRLMEFQERELSRNFQRLEKLENDFKEQLDSIRKEIKERKSENFIPYSELLKKGLLSSGYGYEGANVRTKKKK